MADKTKKLRAAAEKNAVADAPALRAKTALAAKIAHAVADARSK